MKGAVNEILPYMVMSHNFYGKLLEIYRILEKIMGHDHIR